MMLHLQHMLAGSVMRIDACVTHALDSSPAAYGTAPGKTVGTTHTVRPRTVSGLSCGMPRLCSRQMLYVHIDDG